MGSMFRPESFILLGCVGGVALGIFAIWRGVTSGIRGAVRDGVRDAMQQPGPDDSRPS